MEGQRDGGKEGLMGGCKWIIVGMSFAMGRRTGSCCRFSTGSFSNQEM
jgi:hypothetical protein